MIGRSGSVIADRLFVDQKLSASVFGDVTLARRQPFANASIVHNERFTTVHFGIEIAVSRFGGDWIDVAVFTCRRASLNIRKLRTARKSVERAGELLSLSHACNFNPPPVLPILAPGWHRATIPSPFTR